jgi:outer membrane protein assembly factor BamB
LEASPTVAAGLVYIGAESGAFYALSEATGTTVWSRQLDTEPKVTCAGHGITATAAVEPDPVSGISTVYVSGARYLYALDAASGDVMWQTQIGPASPSDPDAYYNWSSPTVAAGHIYVGLSSSCDNPLIRGGEVELDQHTGEVLHTWYSVPSGSIGGSIWSSAAATAGDVWVSTGNECDPTIDTCPVGNQVGYSLSIVHLSASLTLLQAWQAPKTVGHNWDFGSSPTLFGAGGPPSQVGACNKNGRYYALAANPLSSTSLWEAKVDARPDQSCLASSVWNGQTGDLYVAGGPTIMRGTSYGGSIREVSPQSGSYIWQTGLPCAVMGTPSVDSAGVIAAGTYRCPTGSSPGAYLIDAGTGSLLNTLPVGSTRVFGQPVFAQGTLFVATETGGLFNFAP